MLDLSKYENGDISAYELFVECKRLQVLEKQVLAGCDGKCAPDECVCPQGGWEHKVDMLTIEIERLQKIVEKLKCCNNCDHYGEEGELECLLDPESMIAYMADFKCEKWSRE